MKYLISVLLALTVIIPNSALAVTTSGTNRLLIDVVDSHAPALVTSMAPSSMAPVYKIKLTNYAPNGGKAAVVSAIDLVYRSSDAKFDDLEAVSVYEIQPNNIAVDYITMFKGNKYFTSWFNSYYGEIYIPANESVTLVFYAHTRSAADGAKSGDKFQFSIGEVAVGEADTGNIIKSNPFGKQSEWITVL